MEDSGRDSPASLNSTGDMWPSVEWILKLLYQCTQSESLARSSRVVPNVSRWTSSAFSILLVDSSTALSWGAALGRQRPLYAEGLEHQVDLGVVELAAAVRMEYLDVRDGEGDRRERRLDQPGVLPGPDGVTDDLPVAGVDEQAGVVPRGPDAHVGQVAAYMGARRPAAEAARDDVGHVGLVDRPGVHLEPLPAVCADQAVLPHDAADPAPADGDARPPGRRLYLARAVPALAGVVGRDHGRRGGVRRVGPVGPRAHGVVRRPRDAEEPALR